MGLGNLDGLELNKTAVTHWGCHLETTLCATNPNGVGNINIMLSTQDVYHSHA